MAEHSDSDQSHMCDDDEHIHSGVEFTVCVGHIKVPVLVRFRLQHQFTVVLCLFYVNTAFLAVGTTSSVCLVAK